LAAEVLLWLIVHVLKPLTAHTKTNLDDFLIDSLPKPLRVSALFLGLWAFGQAAFPATLFLGADWSHWLGGALILSAGLLVSGIANALVLWYYQELAPSLRARHGGEAISISQDVFPMARRLVVWAVYFLTLIILLGQFGIEIAPLLAGLGIAGLAVGLALQDTLANFFSGLQLLSDKPVKVGEYIALDNEQGAIKGFVEEVGWRTTRIRTRGNCTYFIPNKLLGNSLIVNFSRGLDDNWKGSSFKVGVDYSADPARVRNVILDAIQRLQKDDPRLGAQEPKVRLEEFGDSALIFKVMWTVNDFSKSEATAGIIRESVLLSLRAHKIGIPYPTRTLLLEGKKGPARKRR
jgi:small-conductance mechanosensitive channel